MRSSCTTESYKWRRIEPIGLARSRHDLAVSRLVFTVFLTPPAPAFLRLRVHPLVGLLPLQRTFLDSSALGFRFVRLPWGSLTLHRDIRVPSPHTAGVPRPAFVPPSAFLTLSTVYSSSHFAGLFHPTATSEIHSSGVSPSSQSSELSLVRALLSFLPSASRRASSPMPARDPRLQGFTPTAGPL
jgi:hypothetical protein